MRKERKSGEGSNREKPDFQYGYTTIKNYPDYCASCTCLYLFVFVRMFALLLPEIKHNNNKRGGHKKQICIESVFYAYAIRKQYASTECGGYVPYFVIAL